MKPRGSIPTVLAVLALVALAGCGAEASGAGIGVGDGPGGPGGTTTTIDGTTTTWIEHPPPVELPNVGDLPTLVTEGPAARVTECAIDPHDPDGVLVVAEVVNLGDGPRILQGVPITVRDEDGTVISEESAELWNSITIGPGRRALLSDVVAVEGRLPTAVACELGEPDLRDEPRGDVPDADLVELDGCDPIVVRAQNPHGPAAGVAVLVEAFDAEGYSAGTFELGQWPTNYSKPGHGGGPEDEALAPGATGTYRVDPMQRVSDWGTPLAGPITSCVVSSARIVADPAPIEVIVD